MISALTPLHRRSLIFLRRTEAKFAVTLGINFKGSWEDFIMVDFLSLIIFDYSFGYIITELLELMIGEILMLSSFLLTSISKTKWQGRLPKSACFTSTIRFSFASDVELRGRHSHPPLHGIALPWAGPAKSILCYFFLCHDSFLSYGFCLKHYFLVANHRSRHIIAVNRISLWAYNFLLWFILKSGSFFGIWILLRLQVFANLLFFLILGAGNTSLGHSWRLFRWLWGRSEWVALEGLAIHVWSTIDYFTINSSGTSEWTRNASCQSTECTRWNLKCFSSQVGGFVILKLQFFRGRAQISLLFWWRKPRRSRGGSIFWLNREAIGANDSLLTVFVHFQLLIFDEHTVFVNISLFHNDNLFLSLLRMEVLLRPRLIAILKIWFRLVIVRTEPDSLGLLAKMVLRWRHLVFCLTVPASTCLCAYPLRVSLRILTHIKRSCTWSHF